ncbi:AAA family ATPase, partial [Candidatus Babeliales bacterium]|nr:AAA family ATPase [Candidatus Babeliales bacterium]
KPNNQKLASNSRFVPQHTAPQQNGAPQNHGGFFPLFGGMQGNMGDPRVGAMERGQTNFKQYDPKEQKQEVMFKDVLGQKEAINEVSEVVDFLKNPEEYQKLGAEIPKGVLLEGSPGNGKTLLARAIAGEAGCTFIHASGSQFVNKYVGTGADNVRKLFDQARAQAPAIVFIDEIDAIGSRDRDENQEYRHTINELLTQLDGFTQEDNIIVIAATNFAKSLDKALLRPGRLDRIVKVGFPSVRGRRDILKYYIAKKKLDPTLKIEKLADNFSKRTPRFSGAELKKLANEAALAARRDNAKVVNTKHFETAYDKIILGLANDLERTPEQLKRTAYHEAGHTLVKVLTDQPVAKVSILSKGDALGATFEKLKYETASEYQKEELIHKIMALQAGFVAEKVALNSNRPGASADLEQVNQVANAMVKEFGMGSGDLEGITYKGMLSNDMKNKFDKEVLNLVQDCRKKTETLVSQNKPLLKKLADELFKKETLDEAEILKIVGKKA